MNFKTSWTSRPTLRLTTIISSTRWVLKMRITSFIMMTILKILKSATTRLSFHRAAFFHQQMNNLYMLRTSFFFFQCFTSSYSSLLVHIVNHIIVRIYLSVCSQSFYHRHISQNQVTNVNFPCISSAYSSLLVHIYYFVYYFNE